MTRCEHCHRETETHTHLGHETCRECRERELVRSVLSHLTLESAEELVREGVERDARTNRAFRTVLELVRS